MNILMISDVFFPRINGVSTSILTFTRCLSAGGHRVTLIAPAYPAGYTDTFDVIRIPSLRIPMDPEDGLMQMRAIKRLLPILKLKQYDLVHIHTPFAAHYAGVWLARKLDLPVVVSYHTFFEAYLDKYLPWIPATWLRLAARTFSRTQCNDVNGVISPSRQMLDHLRRYGVTQNACVIPTGLPLEKFKLSPDNDFRNRYDIPRDAYVLLYLGRVAYEKNIDFLVRMFSIVKQHAPNAIMVIAGEGPAKNNLKKQVSAMGLSGDVRFIGYLKPMQAVVDCYDACNLFVFASETETQGLVLLEAMACGTPVVSCACLGSEDVLHEGVGCRISPLETDTFAAKVIEVISDPSITAALRQRGLEYVKAWSDSVKTEEMIAFYMTITGQAPQPASPTKNSHGISQGSEVET